MEFRSKVVVIILKKSHTNFSEAETLTSECPESHPYAYYNGYYCCESGREKVHTLDGDKCDGSAIQIDSLCCLGDRFIDCPLGICESHPGTKADVILFHRRILEYSWG